MSNIVLKTDVVNQTVIPAITSVADKIKTAQSKCSTLLSLLPSSFPNTAQVSKLSYSLSNSVRDVMEAKKTINQKVEYANNIESKHASKTSSLLSKLGGVAGAVVGAATGGVVGAVAGGIIGSKVTEPIMKTGAKIAKSVVSGVAKVATSVGKGIVNAGKAIVNAGAKVVKGFVSGTKKVVTAVGSGIKKAATAIKNTGAKIVKGFVSGVKKVGKAIGDGLKWAGGKIAQGAKAIAGFATKAAKSIWNGLKAAGNWVWNGLKKVGATIANVVVSLVEGIVSFVEAIGDFVVIALGAVGTIFTGFSDIVHGIATGEWDWAATGALWKKGVLPVVAYNWTDKAFSALYETKVFKAIENNAAGWAKRDGGIVYSIGKGVGYYTGVIVASVFTAGAAGAGTSLAASTTSMVANGLVAGTAELGRATQNNYNSMIDKNTKNYYIEAIMQENPNLTTEEATAIVNEAIENGILTNYDEVRKYQQDNLSGGDFSKIMLASTSQAVVEGITVSLLRDKKLAESIGKVGKLANVVQNGAVTISKTHAVNGIGKAATQFGKAYVKELTTMIVDNDYDAKKATVDGTAGVITEVLNANVGLKNIKTGKYFTLKKPKVIDVDDSSGLLGSTSGDGAAVVNEKAVENIKLTFSKVFTEGIKGVKEKHIITETVPERFIKDSYKGVAKNGVVSPIVSAIVN